MSGNSYLLDTNAIIALLSGNDLLTNTLKNAGRIGVSIISVIEFYLFSKLSKGDKTLFDTLLQRIEMINISADFDQILSVANLRVKNKLKLPDAIIADCAMQSRLTLVTNDKHFSKINNLQILTF
ncbi:MAG: PIN domain-containing protein [Niabella sp.]